MDLRHLPFGKCKNLTLYLTLDFLTLDLALDLTFDITLDRALDLMLSVLSIGMSSPLSNVVGVTDMDDFMINGRFYCKELGALRVGDAVACLFLFDIRVRWDM